jgi:hypothetical protein
MAWRPLLTAAKPRAEKGAKDDDPGAIVCHNVDVFGGQWLVVRRDGGCGHAAPARAGLVGR